MAATDSFTTAASLVPPRPAHRLNTDALSKYVLDRLPAALLPDGVVASELTVQQFSHGQSNPTYLLTWPAAVTSSSPAATQPATRLVLRKKPPGTILASAHAVEREHAVLAALAGYSRVPVPRPLLLCEDSGVIGTPFFVMEFVDGKVFVDPNLPGCEAAARTAIYRDMGTTLAALHTVDPTNVPALKALGNPSGYCRRQLQRWSAQYRASLADPAAPNAAMVQLMQWLGQHIPPNDEAPPRPAVCHGDYRLDNLVYEPTSLRVRAVLDWELCTLGDPWADVAYNCLPYHLPAGMLIARLQSPLPLGIPTEQQYVATYCAALGVQQPPPLQWAFYLALSIFRLASILAGVQARARQGNASSAHAEAMSSPIILQALVDAALDIISCAEASTSTPTHLSARSAPGTSSSNRANSGSDKSDSRSSSGSSGGNSGSGGGSSSFLSYSPHVLALRKQVEVFVAEHVIPLEEAFEERANGPHELRWTPHPQLEVLKAKAKAAGLWNLWLPAPLATRISHLKQTLLAHGNSTGSSGSGSSNPSLRAASRTDAATDAAVLLGGGLTNLEYAHVCEAMGTSLLAPECFNCSAPDTGNMEVLAKYGTPEQQRTWLLPLLRGHIRSCFAMTEKAVASSDATNIQASIKRVGDQYVLEGVKWWTSGAMDPRCTVAIFMGKTDPSAAPHKQQSMILVPMDAPGVKVVRPMLVYGYDDAPHGHAEVHFSQVKVPVSNMLLGEGRGFEIAQGRLGPGRLHHCMRLVGMAERAIGLMATRAQQRTAFGGPLAKQGALRSELAKARVDLDGARLLVLAAADALDRLGNKAARGAIATAKVSAPNMALRIIDAAVQVHGGAGVCQDTVLARLWAGARTLRIADGPDEVHLGTIAGLELAKHRSGAASKL